MDIHTEPDDPYTQMWKQSCSLFQNDTIADMVLTLFDIPDTEDGFDAKLPYLTESAFYCFTLIANEYLCASEGSAQSALSEFFGLDRMDYIHFVSKYAFKKLSASTINSYLAKIQGNTVGEMLISANKCWNHSGGDNKPSKDAVLYLIGFPLGFCFILKEGQQMMQQLLKDKYIERRFYD